MSFYRKAIDKTTATLNKRAKHFRNLIVAVTVVGPGSVLWSVLSWSWLPLTSMLLLIPLCGLYLFVDSKVLGNWRCELLSAWERHELDFSAFHEAITSIGTLPKNSIQSMLASLPSAGDLVVEQGITSSTRHAISTVITTINRCRLDLLAFKTVGFTIIGIVIVAAIVLWQWQPLLGAAAIGFIFVIKNRMTSKHLECAGGSIRESQKSPDFNLENFKKAVDTIPWSPISFAEKQTFLTSVSRTS